VTSSADREVVLARRVSNAVVVLSALFVSVSVFIAFTQPPITKTDEADWLYNVIVIVGFAIYGAMGCLIVRRQPRNTIGWLLLIVPLVGSLTLANGAYTDQALVRAPGSLPFGTLGAWFDRWLLVLALEAFIPIFLLFPDGRLPSRSRIWRSIGWVTFVAPIVTTLAFALTPGRLTGAMTHLEHLNVTNPVGIPGTRNLMNAISQISGMAMLATGLAGFVGLIARYRRAASEVRQQIRWLALVGAAFVAVLVGGIILGIAAPELSDGAVGTVIFSLAFTILVVGIPAACGVAILRYRLWDLDVVIRKAVVFAILAGFISLIYAGVSLLPILIVGSGSDSDLRGVVFAGTVVLVLLFQPVRQRARRFADRLVYGERATPYQVLSEFSGRVGEAYASDDVLPRIARVLVEATGATSAVVWLRTGGALRPAAVWPAGPLPESLEVGDDAASELEGLGIVQVRHQGELLGALGVTMPPNDPLDPQRDRMIHDLAGQAGLVMRNVLLIEDLRASRQRLVAAQDEERRRIERDLHDGAQQQLVALTVQLKLAETMLARDPAKGLELLDGLQGTAGDALEDLRQLARGIYPPLLADQGLIAALSSQAGRAAIPTTVDGDEVGRYAREIESAVYFCSLEALNNVVKYAGATRAEVTLRRDDGYIEFRVRDDGAGFDPDSTDSGTGLQGMADRVNAVGGSLRVESAPGAGTTVTGRVPAREPVRT